MKTYLLSKFQCIQSRLTVSRFIGVCICILTVLFVIYYVSFEPGRPLSTIVYINRNTSSETHVFHRHSAIINEDLKFEPLPKAFNKAQKPTCLIVVRTTDGGIGNRMFLFASAYGLARLHQCDLYVGPWIVTDLRSIFTVNLNHTPVHLVTRDSVVNDSKVYGRYSACTLFDDLLRVPLRENLTRYEMIGFYQAFGYFVKYKEEISYLFQFNQAAVRTNVPLVEQLLKAVWDVPIPLGNYTKDNVTHGYLKALLTRPPPPLIPVTWIAVHIRRGDFLTFFRIDTSVSYLTMAMNFYRRKYINCRFLIASDDKDYAKTHFGSEPDVFITPKSFFSGDDLAALALCEHTIVTAGSYGWWAAWLAGGNVIHDLNYPVPSQACPREHYFPPWFFFPHSLPVQNVTTTTTTTTTTATPPPG